MAQLAAAPRIPPAEMIFIGDTLYSCGNDSAVHETGIDTIAIRELHETDGQPVRLECAWHRGTERRPFGTLRLKNCAPFMSTFRCCCLWFIGLTSA